MGGYDETYRRWQRDPDAFWLGLASAVEWEHEPEAALDASGAPLYRWFPDGRLNMCFNLLDRHVRDGRGEQAALIYDSPVTGQVRTYTYRELLDETARVAGAFARLGVAPRRSGGHLHADGSGGPHGHDGLRAARGDPLGGVRRVRRQRARVPYRGLPAQADRGGVVRDRAVPGRRVWAAAQPRTRDRRGRPSPLRDPSAPSG